MSATAIASSSRFFTWNEKNELAISRLLIHDVLAARRVDEEEPHRVHRRPHLAGLDERRRVTRRHRVHLLERAHDAASSSAAMNVVCRPANVSSARFSYGAYSVLMGSRE